MARPCSVMDSIFDSKLQGHCISTSNPRIQRYKKVDNVEMQEVRETRANREKREGGDIVCPQGRRKGVPNKRL